MELIKTRQAFVLAMANHIPDLFRFSLCSDTAVFVKGVQ
jgi:hypothetical protein